MNSANREHMVYEYVSKKCTPTPWGLTKGKKITMMTAHHACLRRLLEGDGCACMMTDHHKNLVFEQHAPRSIRCMKSENR
jgi:hypothetical protein